MIWEQPPQGISVAPTDRLKRALEEGDTRRRESLARHEAWSRAREQWRLREQARLGDWLETFARRPTLAEFFDVADGWVADGGRVETGLSDFQSAWVILRPDTTPPAAYGSASLLFITPNGCRPWTAGHHRAITWSGQLVTGLPMTLRVPAPDEETALRQQPVTCDHDEWVELRELCQREARRLCTSCWQDLSDE